MGDNLDLTVRVWDMQMENRDKSVHCYHHMAAQTLELFKTEVIILANRIIKLVRSCL